VIGEYGLSSKDFEFGVLSGLSALASYYAHDTDREIVSMTRDNQIGPLIAVCGAQNPPPAVYSIAEDVGSELARAGAVLVCGGLEGVMEAACKGAARHGGLTIGILPGLDPREANRWVKIPIATGIGHARNLAVVATSHAVIAVDGGFGTLSEIAYALRIGRPVVGLASWTLQPGEHNSDLEDGVVLHPASDPAEAVRLAIHLATTAR
jgi:uncharacterized protein (TIGR00725 family)